VKLRTIDAQSFGLLKAAKLDDLGDGLNVICGPNESGKTSFRELVRMVLYGFPDGRSKESNRYFAPDGSRAGRLVFEGEGGRWALSRSGDKSGTPKVETISGAERASLRDDIVGNVTDQTYRVLFGFGLDELPAIGTPGDDAVLARVYGEAVASGKNLCEVRTQLGKSADAILSPGGKGALGKETWAAIKSVRARISDLESSEREFTADQARLKQLEAELAAAKAGFEAADARVRTLTLDAQGARTLTESLAEMESQAADLAAAAEERRAHAKRCKVDDHLLAIGPALQVLLNDMSRALDKAEQAKQKDEAAAERERKAASHGLPEDLLVHEGDRARLDAWRAEKPSLEAAAAQAVAAAEKAEAHARGESAKAESAGGTGTPTVVRVLSAVMLLVGAAGVAAGLLMSQLAAAAIGGAVAVLALVLLASSRAGASGPTHDSVRAQGEAVEARAFAEAAQANLAKAQSDWEAWVASRGLLGRGTDIAAVQSLLDDAAKRDEQLAAAAAFRAEAQSARAVFAEWGEALATLAKGPLGIAEKDPEPQALAIRAAEELKRVQATRDERDAALKEAEAADAQNEAVARKAQAARERLEALAKAHAVKGEIVGALEALEAAARQDADVARAAVEQAVGEYGALSGKLEAEGRDAELTMARQELEGLLATAQEQAEDYVVESLALDLVGGAIKRFEKERQPDIVRIAQGLFSEMTGGRYISLTVPAGGAEINVANNEGRQMSSGLLSSGAREQLYLALRVALISNLGALAPALPVLMDDIMANYDAERVDDAVCAIRELVKVRQVLFFTCHEATAEALAAGVAGSRTLKLGRCGF
jgi:uncharacterized protein YhaN